MKPRRHTRSKSKIKRLLKNAYEYAPDTDVVIIHPGRAGRRFKPVSLLEIEEAGISLNKYCFHWWGV